jgi:septation ring formation regulator EzrA
MVKLTEFAKSYDSKTTKNISDLPEVSIDIDLVDDEFEFAEANGNTKTVKQKVVVIEDEKYRVPTSVIQQLKVMLEDNPNLKKFKVKKTGEGKDNTRYTVIPLL